MFPSPSEHVSKIWVNSGFSIGITKHTAYTLEHSSTIEENWQASEKAQVPSNCIPQESLDSDLTNSHACQLLRHHVCTPDLLGALGMTWAPWSGAVSVSAEIRAMATWLVARVLAVIKDCTAHANICSWFNMSTRTVPVAPKSPSGQVQCQQNLQLSQHAPHARYFGILSP